MLLSDVDCAIIAPPRTALLSEPFALTEERPPVSVNPWTEWLEERKATHRTAFGPRPQSFATAGAGSSAPTIKVFDGPSSAFRRTFFDAANTTRLDVPCTTAPPSS